ncbi:hypothetical protein GW17_00060634 [Ensete ventricosum]|nr:hypothetical protein GW17_00060634 [Ensete ventricosum]
MRRIIGGCLVFDHLRRPSARLTHLELTLQCAHEVVDEGLPVVAPRIGVDGEKVVVDEVVAPQGHHVASLCEEVVGRRAPDLPPYQLLSPLEQFDLLVEGEPLHLQQHPRAREITIGMHAAREEVTDPGVVDLRTARRSRSGFRRLRRRTESVTLLDEESTDGRDGRRDPSRDTNNVGDGSAIGEPPVGQALSEIDSVPWQSGPSQAPGEVVVVADVRQGVAEDELHDCTGAALVGDTEEKQHDEGRRQLHLPSLHEHRLESFARGWSPLNKREGRHFAELSVMIKQAYRLCGFGDVAAPLLPPDSLLVKRRKVQQKTRAKRFGLGRVPPMLKSGVSSSGSKNGASNGQVQHSKQCSARISATLRLSHVDPASFARPDFGVSSNDPVVDQLSPLSTGDAVADRRTVPPSSWQQAACQGWRSGRPVYNAPDDRRLMTCQGDPNILALEGGPMSQDHISNFIPSRMAEEAAPVLPPLRPCPRSRLHLRFPNRGSQTGDNPP